MRTRVRKRRHPLQPSWSNVGAHRTRFEQMRTYFSGRSVLDIGCASGWRRSDWFHELIRAEAKELVGLDIDREAVRRIDRRGYELAVGDATNFDLGRTFDVVHAGELLEHLDDPRGFLASAHRHMRDDSLLVVTTPNAFCFSNFVYRIGGKAYPHREHVCWYCEDTLRQLLERNGFDVVELSFLEHETPGRVRAVASSALRSLLPRRLAWNTILATARRRSGGRGRSSAV